ncbi:MAG: hypothetical protein WA766_17285, partial [Candidatus Acidiferrales bacterium]
INARGIGNLGRHLQLRHLDGKVSGGHGQLNEPAHFLDFFFLNPKQRVEAANFAGYPAIEIRSIEMGDRADAALAGDDIFPYFIGADATSANEADTCHHNTAIQCAISPVRNGTVDYFFECFSM